MEDGTTLNANQKKPYNAKFEFFTKNLGPGHYEPSVEITKPKSKGTAWCAGQATKDRMEDSPGRNANNPGPGDYNF